MASSAVDKLFDFYLTRMIEGEKAVRHMLDERDRLALELNGAPGARIMRISEQITRLDVQIDHFMKRVDMYARLTQVVGKAL